MSFTTQVRTLIHKNLRRLLLRQLMKCVWIGLILPVALCTFFCFATNLVTPPAKFGVGRPRPVGSLSWAFDVAKGSGRHKIALVNSGHAGGKIEKALDQIDGIIRALDQGVSVLRIEHETSLSAECVSNLRGATECFGAVVMRSSPGEGVGTMWNYTIFTDAALANSPSMINIQRRANNEQVYLLPLQRLVDSVIAMVDSGNTSADLLASNNELPFTSLTEPEREAKARRFHHRAIVNSMGVTFLSAVLWISYHLTGFIAAERETGMRLLIDAMIDVDQPWMAAAAHTTAYHVSFSLIYAPAWIVSSVMMHYFVYYNTNIAIVLALNVLGGLAIASMSTLVASLFKTAQLSGVTATLAILLLGILAQTITRPGTVTIAILSLLFAPCGYVYSCILMARFELKNLPTDLVASPNDGRWYLPGVILWVFLIVQIFVYPLLAALIDGRLSNTCITAETGPALEPAGGKHVYEHAVYLQDVCKIYEPSKLKALFSKPREPVVAVNNLTLKAGRGQIVVLLGANGSGKSTAMNAIAGWSKLTGGTITIDRTGGFGVAPQNNVLWDDLTVEEHLRLFSRLKSPKTPQDEMQARVTELIEAVGLLGKRESLARILSGGQKRKLQLGMMLIGGSRVCCVDEVSSGVDPLSRRKLWDILLAERGKRTIILTTHFLDEADLLADHVAIMSRGSVRAQGSSTELKDRFGSGYTIKANADKSHISLEAMPMISGLQIKVARNSVSYNVASSRLAAEVIRTLESMGITEYTFSGPTIEDVFLRLAEEAEDEQVENEGIADAFDKDGSSRSGSRQETELRLTDRRTIGYGQQISILLGKRLVVMKRNWLPYVVAVLLPIVAAGLTSLYVHGESPVGCAPSKDISTIDEKAVFEKIDKNTVMFLAGPASKMSALSLTKLFQPVFSDPRSPVSSLGSAALGRLHIVNTHDAFLQFIDNNHHNLTTGLWLGDRNTPPTIGWVADLFITSSLNAQQLLDIALTNTTIATTWLPFQKPFNPGVGGTLSLVIYMGIALACFPAFFALYPSYERMKSVRELQYSNGVQPVSLWMAYISFDFVLCLAGVGTLTALWAALSSVWYHLGYVFVVFALYGLASILFSYFVSLFTKTQLATFAWSAALQLILFLLYLMSFMLIITYVPVAKLSSTMMICHFSISLIAPIGSAARALFLVTNLYGAACSDNTLYTNPGGIARYGGPILYLILQCIILFCLLIWVDVRSLRWSPGSFSRGRDNDKRCASPTGVLESEAEASGLSEVPVEGRDNGLEVSNLTKSYGNMTAIDNISFSIKRGEIFALLGPNGAGKTTLISLVRGHTKLSSEEGVILIDHTSVVTDPASVRAKLGVCPQIDALDKMTVQEHLEFYARVQGISDVDHNVSAVLHAVGLENMPKRIAQTLSGGNKRKLSLGIALMGNPSVILLDEPSSGLDASSKRIMWKTLLAIVPNRSILLTTHSMEEADAVASCVGILARRMLALGTPDELCCQFSDVLHVHLVSTSAPLTSAEEMQRTIRWIYDILPTASIEPNSHHGQIRFSIKTIHVPNELRACNVTIHSAIGRLVVMLEGTKSQVGIQHFSVTPTTLGQVFLKMVGDNESSEEPVGGAKRTNPSRFARWASRVVH